MQPPSPCFPGNKVVKNPPANAGYSGDMGLIPGSEDPLEKEMATHSRILAGNSQGQRRLAGYSSCGRKSVRHNIVTKQQQQLTYLYTKVSKKA